MLEHKKLKMKILQNFYNYLKQDRELWIINIDTKL